MERRRKEESMATKREPASSNVDPVLKNGGAIAARWNRTRQHVSGLCQVYYRIKKLNSQNVSDEEKVV